MMWFLSRLVNTDYRKPIVNQSALMVVLVSYFYHTDERLWLISRKCEGEMSGADVS